MLLSAAKAHLSDYIQQQSRNADALMGELRVSFSERNMPYFQPCSNPDLWALQALTFQSSQLKDLDSRTYRTVGAEALLRWADRTDASIPTEVLVRMAEEKGHDSLKSQLTKLYVPVHTGCADRILLGKGKTELESRSLQVRRCSNRALDSARRGTDYFMSVR
jgi:sensor c-di-GMP phosphodiesterase-like protein